MTATDELREALDARESIDVLDLSTRVLNLLHRAGIHTVGQLKRTSDARLMSIRSFGIVSLHEVRAKVVEYGRRVSKARNECHDCLGEREPFECSECHRRTNDTKWPNYCWYCGRKVVSE